MLRLVVLTWNGLTVRKIEHCKTPVEAESRAQELADANRDCFVDIYECLDEHSPSVKSLGQVRA